MAIETPNQIVSTSDSTKTTTLSTITEVTTPINTVKLSPNQQQVTTDLNTMIQYASHRGIAIPATINLSAITSDKILIEDYNTMIKAIAPATVQSINYIHHHILGEDGEDKKWYYTPIISKCLFIAGAALLALISISLSSDVNTKNQEAGLLASHGWVLFYNLIFICSASLLGVMFYLLKTISDKIKDHTLLPVDSIEVNATIIIGVISGFIIAELFKFDENAFTASIETQKMTLALLGGFSSDAIFSVLKGVVNKTKALFSTPNN